MLETTNRRYTSMNKRLLYGRCLGPNLVLARHSFAWESMLRQKNIFDNLIKQNKSLAASYDWLAKSYVLLDDSISAQETLQKAVDISPKAIRRQRALGELALRNKDGAMAEKALSQAVLLGKNSVHRHPIKLHQSGQIQVSERCRQRCPVCIETDAQRVQG